MAIYRYWVGIFSCFLLFSLVFLGLNAADIGRLEAEYQGETGLLLFIVPGFVASYLTSKKRILCPLFGALYALPLCHIVRYFWLTPLHSFWHEFAYATSAVFWCVFGSMLYLFIRVLLPAVMQQHQRERS